MAVILAILAAIVVLGPLVALHEWGHYIVARWCGVKVLTYSIGFGFKLFGWTSKKTGIQYKICAIPLGGYVRMLDEREGEVAEKDKPFAFNNQTPLKKIAIVAAGPIMNFIIAILLFWILFLTPSEQLNTRIGAILPNSPIATQNLAEHTQQPKIHTGDKILAINGHAVQTWEEINYQLMEYMGESPQIKLTIQPYQNNQPHGQAQTYPYQLTHFMQEAGKDDLNKDALESLGILPWQPKLSTTIHELTPDGAAIRQGLQIGDKILAINHHPTPTWMDVQYQIKNNPEKLLDFTVERSGTTQNLKIMPQAKKDAMGNRFGQIGANIKVDQPITVPDDYKIQIAHDPLTAFKKSLAKTQQLSLMTLVSIKKMFFGQIGLENISGPITIAQVAKQSFSISWQFVLSTAGMISLSLAVLNLLPIPVLDGGHLLFYFVELIRGKPLSEKVQNLGFNLGFLLLAGFMILAISNDLNRFF